MTLGARRPHEKPHTKTIAYRAIILSWRDRFRFLFTGRIACVVKVTAPRWVPDTKHEVAWQIASVPVHKIQQRIGFNRDAFRDPDEPSGSAEK